MESEKPYIPYSEIARLFQADRKKLGAIEKPTKDGLLLIAELGAKTWNSWLPFEKSTKIDFSGTDFTQTDIDFSEFSFNSVNFDNSKFFRGNFSSCKFSGDASFRHCTFEEDAEFSSCFFHDAAFFECCNFKHADFSNSKFSKEAIFISLKSGGRIYFKGSKFLSDADFSGSVFSSMTNFSYAEFAKTAIFRDSKFSGPTTFHEANIWLADFRLTTFSDQFDFSCRLDSDPKPTSTVYFSGCKFEKNAIFNNRKFGNTTIFGKITHENGKVIATRFKRAPTFHGCKIHQDTSFDGAIFETPNTQESARAFRTLKLAMEQLKATREEQRFFHLEMKAERQSLPLPRRALSFMYEILSDYGFSLWRPLAWLLIFSIAFSVAHGALAYACAASPACAATPNFGSSNEQTSDLIKYVLVNTAPVPGLDKMQTELRKPLFGEHGAIAVTALALEILHKIVTLVMTFLFALGLRNLFKMKT